MGFVIEAMRKTQGKDMIRIQNEAGKNWGLFDKVNGTNATRLDLQVGRSVDNIVKSWSHGLEKFRTKRHPYLIYKTTN